MSARVPTPTVAPSLSPWTRKGTRGMAPESIDDGGQFYTAVCGRSLQDRRQALAVDLPPGKRKGIANGESELPEQHAERSERRVSSAPRTRLRVPYSISGSPPVGAAWQVVLVSLVGISASGLGEATADHVADSNDGDKEPCAAGRECIDVGTPVAVALADYPSGDQDADHDGDHRPELGRLKRMLRLRRQPHQHRWPLHRLTLG